MSAGINNNHGDTERLGTVVFQYSLFNLLLAAIIGIFLRSVPVTDFGVTWYKNILHAHSHFAFGGWVMPALLVLLMKYYQELVDKIAFKHWRNIAMLLLLSAYGMLLSFPFQGYGPVSICFSTLSILASFYLVFVIWRVKRELANSTSLLFLYAGIFFLVISSLGPFATAPLIIMGKAGTALYFNAIYFYLHFQYNGWFSFLLLGVLYKIIGVDKPANGNRVFLLLTVACVPAYFLSVLWSHPPFVFYILGAGAALLQIAALIYLVKDIITKQPALRIHPLIYLALLVFSVKLLLQLAGALPVIADMAYEHRNFIIAYLHFVLLGFVSFFILAANLQSVKPGTISDLAMGLFVFTWVLTELILVWRALSEVFFTPFPGYEKWILAVSCLYPIAIFFLWLQAVKKKSPAAELK